MFHQRLKRGHHVPRQPLSKSSYLGSEEVIIFTHVWRTVTVLIVGGSACTVADDQICSTGTKKVGMRLCFQAACQRYLDTCLAIFAEQYLSLKRG